MESIPANSPVAHECCERLVSAFAAIEPVLGDYRLVCVCGTHNLIGVKSVSPEP